MMMDTSTPRKRKNVKMRRLTVELRLEGQQPHRMQGAEPQRQDACGGGAGKGRHPYSPPLFPVHAQAHSTHPPPIQHLQMCTGPAYPAAGKCDPA